MSTTLAQTDDMLAMRGEKPASEQSSMTLSKYGRRDLAGREHEGIVGEVPQVYGAGSGWMISGQDCDDGVLLDKF
jgi:hypothetical protein